MCETKFCLYLQDEHLMWSPDWIFILFILCSGTCNNIHKVTASLLDTLCLISWFGRVFFFWHYCVHTCCVMASCPFDVEGSLARDVVCVEPESGCSPFLVQWLDWVVQWLCYLPHFRVMAEVKHQPYLAWNKCLIKPCLHCDNFIICP
jgi:hypothetical protein